MFKSDTDKSFGLDEPEENKRRLERLMSAVPRLMFEDSRNRLYHRSNTRQPCLFRVEKESPTISYFVPYEIVEIPNIGRAVVARSWASLLYGIGTSSKDRVFFVELPKLADVIVSHTSLTVDSIRFWLDLQAHLRRKGYVVGLLHGDGRVTEYMPDTCLDEHWVDDFALMQELETNGDMRLFYAKMLHSDRRARSAS